MKKNGVNTAIIVITLPVFFHGESAICNQLFENGLEILHLRKPEASREQFEIFLQQIHPCFLDRIIVHQYYDLTEKYGLGGIHIQYEEKDIAKSCHTHHVGISCHSLQELNSLEFTPTYCFLSPLFDSVSKKGYKAAFPIFPDFKQHPVAVPVFGLGGITPEKIGLCLKNGFVGVALIGYIWEQPMEAVIRFRKMNTIMNINISKYKLQYITDYRKDMTIEEQVVAVCKGGVRWIQLRMKEASYNEMLKKAQAIKDICLYYQTVFIINDRVDIVQQVDADGVHLGKDDMQPKEARKILGEGKIIGATCNTFEDIAKAVEEKADYIGLGPYTYTITKKKLSPVLGLNGYKEMVSKMESAEINIPIYGIGGIKDEDIVPILTAGINGIALSGLIKNDKNMEEKTRSILKLITMLS